MSAPTELVAVDEEGRLQTWTSGTTTVGPPVVLLHGGPGLWDYLEPVADLLGDRTLVHRYDQRGCGGSTGVGAVTMARWVADLEGLREHWGHARWVVVGHSFGATLALAYAAAHPDRTAGVGYVSGVGIGDWRTPFHAELARRRSTEQAARLAALERIGERSSAEENEFRTLSWFTDYADPEVGFAQAAQMAGSPHAIRWEVNRALNHGDDEVTDAEVVRTVRSLPTPLTVVHGRDDPRPWRAVAALAHAAGREAPRILDGAGHLPWVERPDEVRRLLVDLLDRCSRSG